MLRESSVIAVAGTRRLLIVLVVIFCVAISGAFLIFACLKILGLFGAMAMLTLDGFVPAKDANLKVGLHLLSTVFALGIGILFGYWAHLASKPLTTPFEHEIVKSAEIVNNVETNAKANARSIRDAAKSAIAQAQENRNKVDR